RTASFCSSFPHFVCVQTLSSCPTRRSSDLQQIQQNFTTLHGYDVPPALIEAGLGADYRAAMDAVQSDIERLRASSQEAAVYAIPDRKSTRLKSSHEWSSYAGFCLKNKTPAS